MANAEKVMEEIGIFLDRFSLKTNKLTDDDLIRFIEEKWQEADDEKYTIHQARIYIGRMTNEYIDKKDFDNMMRWLNMTELHQSFQQNPSYIQNYYKGECCLRCGNEEKALEYLFLCYNKNPDYIFERAPFCYEFFNKHLDTPRELPNTEEDEEEPIWSIDLEEWLNFFDEEYEMEYKILKKGFNYAKRPNKKHKKGLEYLQKNQKKILDNILTELLEEYPALQKIYDYSPEEKPDFMPDITDIKEFAGLLSPTTFYIMSDYKDDHPYIGFGFSCSWDPEHGLGIMTHKDKVIKIGGADTAFCPINEEEE